MANQHKRSPVSFRPAASDRAWLEGHAEETGLPVNQVLTAAVRLIRSLGDGLLARVDDYAASKNADRVGVLRELVSLGLEHAGRAHDIGIPEVSLDGQASVDLEPPRAGRQR